MRITQGAFSFLPDLTDEEIAKQVQYCINNNWAVAIEYTDDPHPRNTYWEMFGFPLFDISDAAAVMMELKECRNTFPNHYIKIQAFDSTRGTESVTLSFIVNRPKDEPGFNLVRTEKAGRNLEYTTVSYETNQKPQGRRYGNA